MRLHFHASGFIVLGVIVVLALVAGAVPALWIVRAALVLYVVATFLEIVVNMVRYRDTHIRSRLFGLLFDTTTAPWRRS
jgi:hypothetical protein